MLDYSKNVQKPIESSQRIMAIIVTKTDYNKVFLGRGREEDGPGHQINLCCIRCALFFIPI